MQYFQYSEDELNYLKRKDKALAKAIECIGHINRKVVPDLFTGLIYNIVGQQISAKAADTVWNRFTERFGCITPEVLYNTDINELQKLGISMRKAGYIKEIALRVYTNSFSINEL